MCVGPQGNPPNFDQCNPSHVPAVHFVTWIYHGGVAEHGLRTSNLMAVPVHVPF